MPTLQETLALLKQSKNKYQRGGFTNTVKFKEGKTTVRLLRGPNPKFWADVGVHWIKPAENAKPVAVLGCHDATYDEACPVCAAIDQAIASATNDDDLKLFKSWKARKAVLVNALVLTGDSASPDPQVLEMTPTTFSSFLSQIETYGESDVDVFDPKEGIDFIVERRGKGFDTEYQVMAAPKSKPFDPKVLDKLIDLEAHIAKEHFRGEENKALNAISGITGLTFKALPSPSKAAMLTGPATTAPAARPAAPAAEKLNALVEDAEVVEETPAPKVTPKPAAKAAPAAAPAADAFNADLDVADLDDVLAELDKL